MDVQKKNTSQYRILVYIIILSEIFNINCKAPVYYTSNSFCIAQKKPDIRKYYIDLTGEISFSKQTYEVEQSDTLVLKEITACINRLNCHIYSIVVYHTGGDLDLEESYFKALSIKEKLISLGINGAGIKLQSFYDDKYIFNYFSKFRRIEVVVYCNSD